MLGRLASVGQAGVRVRALGGDRAGEMCITRFLRNRQVTTTEMFATAYARTCDAVGRQHILAIQDTTTLRDDGGQHSLSLHAMIAVSADDGALLGLVGGELLHRHGGRTAKRKQTAYSEKESCRWLNGARVAAGLAASGATCVTVIADREGDIYEDFAYKPADIELLVRAAQDRRLANGGRLFSCADAWAPMGQITVRLPAVPGRPARDTTLELRSGKVTIVQPDRRAVEAARLPKQVELRFVDAREINAPPGAMPAHWRLLTTHAVATLSDAKQIVAFYRERWTIEQLFRTYKTKGFDIEAVRIADVAPFEKLALATLIAAVQVLQLVRDRDGAAARPLEDVFDASDQPVLEAVCSSLEGRTLRQKNPHPKSSLAYAAWVCARLGGWTGYYGKPGPIVTLAGMLRFKAIRLGWQLGHVV